MHIDNLYKNIDIMNFKECYVTEKVHGTSAHISFKGNQLNFFAGGMKHETFVKIFDKEKLEKKFNEHFKDIEIVVYGEAYGGKMQGMSETYGKESAFIVFDVKIGGVWLDVPNAEDVANKLELEFVPYHKVNTKLETLNKYKEMPSEVAKRRGIKEDKRREGIVIRPLIEMIKSNGKRIIVKHKNDEFMETKTKREVNPEKIQILKDAIEIAEEWVTNMRLTHVLDKLGNPTEIENTREVINAMMKDIMREADGEIIVTEKNRKAVYTQISKKTFALYKKRISKI